MGTIEQYRAMLADAESDLGKLELQVEELRVAIRFFNRRIRELEPETPQFPQLQQVRSGEYAGLKLPAAMGNVLQASGRPLHADQIVAKLVEGGYPRSRSLKVSIATTAKRRQDLFVKTGRNTFALKNGAET